MSDTGKVMLGTDGSPLLGVGGIVLADDLYPLIIAGEGTRYSRTASQTVDVSPYDNPIWGVNWATPSLGLQAQLFKTRIYSEEDGLSISYLCGQSLFKRVLNSFQPDQPGLAIAWTRMDTIKFDYTIEATNSWTDEPPVTFNLWIGSKTATAPSGSNEPWDGTGWTEVTTCSAASATAYDDVLTSGTISLPIADTYYLALFASDYAGTGSGEGTTRIVGQSAQLFFRSWHTITYNLATP